MNIRLSKIFLSLIFSFFVMAPVFAGQPRPVPAVTISDRITVTLDLWDQKTFEFLFPYTGKSITTQLKRYTGLVFSSGDVQIAPVDQNVFPDGVAVYTGSTPANETSDGRFLNPWVVSFSGRRVDQVEITLMDAMYVQGSEHTMHVFDQYGLIMKSQTLTTMVGYPTLMKFGLNISDLPVPLPGSNVPPNRYIAKVLFIHYSPSGMPLGEMVLSNVVYRYVH